MYWRTVEGNFLLEGVSRPILLSSSANVVELPNGMQITTASEYFCVSRAGEILVKYSSPWTSTLEDELYVIDIHVVLGSNLYKYFYTERLWHGSRIDGEVLLRDLVAIGRHQLPFDPSQTII
jgi:hypothetical protein